MTWLVCEDGSLANLEAHAALQVVDGPTAAPAEVQGVPTIGNGDRPSMLIARVPGGTTYWICAQGARTHLLELLASIAREIASGSTFLNVHELQAIADGSTKRLKDRPIPPITDPDGGRRAD